jgi:hypothetical protein
MKATALGSLDADELLAQHAAASLEADARLVHLRAAYAGELRCAREEAEAAALRAKMTLNKDVLNELRFGPAGELLRTGRGHAGALGDRFWVATGDAFVTLPGPETIAMLTRNQMQCAKLLEEAQTRQQQAEAEVRLHSSELERLDRERRNKASR